MTYMLPERKKQRLAIKNLTLLQDQIEVAMEKRLQLPDAMKVLLGGLTQTSDIEGQYNGLTSLLDETTEAYKDFLRINGPKSLSCFSEYLNMDEFPAPHHDFLCDHLEAISRRDSDHMRTIISMPPGHAKALRLNTMIPTPYGWSTILDLKVGDQVFDENGVVCNVIRKTGVFKDKECFSVKTDCGDVIVADGEHNWLVRLCEKRNVYHVKTTKYLHERHNGTSIRQKHARTQEGYNNKAAKRPQINRAFALQLPTVTLPIDPYVLGYWLGDGTTRCPQITIGPQDKEWVLGEFSRIGYTLNSLSDPMTFGLHGIRSRFTSLDILGNKHIPMLYLRSSAQQRKSLLQGIVDSDGHIMPTGQVEIASINKELAENYQELVRSLGVKCSIIERTAFCHNSSEGIKDCGPYWTVTFYMKDCARMPRKRDLTRNNERTPGTYIDIEEAGNYDTMCIEVDSASHLFLAGRSMTPTHNSTYSSHYFPAWHLGGHPNHKYIQAGHSQDFVENEFGKRVRGIIDSEPFHDMFPDVSLSSASKAAGAFQLAGKLGRYLTRGVGQGISGYRANIAAVDDPYASRKDAESATVRKEVQDWLMADFMTRLLPRSPMFIIATRWHPLDICGVLEDMTKNGVGMPWNIINLPAIAEEEDDPMGRAIGEALWPDFYDLSHLLALKATLPGRDWSSLYQGKPVDEEGGTIKASWFQRFTKRTTFPKRRTLSVDTANKDGERNDFTVITIWEEDVEGNHYLIHLERKRLTFEPMSALIISTAEQYDVSAILVEDKGSGTQFIQVYQGKIVTPIIPISTSNLSKQFRFDGVTPMFEAGLVFLPEKSAWLADYERELLQFPGSAYDDQVDSTSQYLHWARKGRQLGTKKLGQGNVNQDNTASLVIGNGGISAVKMHEVYLGKGRMSKDFLNAHRMTPGGKIGGVAIPQEEFGPA